VSSVEVRPFRRPDRDQLTSLTNAHVAAVLPGFSLSVNTVLSQLEREPGEFIVDPWVIERVTLVAEQRHRIVGAAHLVRYDTTDAVGDGFRDAGELRWFLFWPDAPYWPDSRIGAERLMEAATGVLDEWGVRVHYADGALPAPGVYGVPAQWPHVRGAYERAGFVHEGRVEVIHVAEVDDLRACRSSPPGGLVARRSVGINGTRISAVLGEHVAGYIEVAVLDDSERSARNGGWADVGNFEVVQEHRDSGIAEWLLGQAADWLHLARVQRLLDYRLAGVDEEVLPSASFQELTRIERGWVRAPDPRAGR
jgi:GNAT superfamily N-acetyltransferase